MIRLCQVNCEMYPRNTNLIVKMLSYDLHWRIHAYVHCRVLFQMLFEGFFLPYLACTLEGTWMFIAQSYLRIYLESKFLVVHDLNWVNSKNNNWLIKMFIFSSISLSMGKSESNHWWLYQQPLRHSWNLYEN